MMESTGRLNHHSEIKSPMPGLILKLKKKTGDEVEAGEPVLILEAMKMENELRSPSKGKIREILVKEGIAVEKGAVLFIIDQSLTSAGLTKK
jgi:biotin carboxyl carrier protein